MGEIMTEEDHIDHFIDYGSPYPECTLNLNEKYARWVFNYFRLSAICKNDFREFMKDHKLFCVYKGKKYKVTGASRLGDVWLAEDLTRRSGYDLRVLVKECGEWSPTP